MRRETEFVLEKAAWPALLLEDDGRICRANQAARALFGFAARSISASLAEIWDDENKISAPEFLQQQSDGNASPVKLRVKSGGKTLFAAQVARIVRDQASYFVVQLFKDAGPPVNVSPVASSPTPPEKTVEDKKVVATEVSASVVPASKDSGDTSQTQKQKLDCALQLARSVALDFNNALTTILGHASLLLNKSESGHPFRGSLVEIEKAACKAAEIANDLAVFSRQEKDARAPLPGNLNLLLEKTLDIFPGTAQNGITVSRQWERKLFTAKFDEAKMQQALIKIFENAVEAIKGPGKINVQTRNLELFEPLQDRTAKLAAGNYVCVEISDTGSGISNENMPRIFEPFFTTKGAAHRGLGLAWVYGIVTNHGGGVAMSSKPGIGTEVRLYLPANLEIVREQLVADVDLKGTQTILLVDDEELVLTMGRMVLSTYGYTVLTANSGQKALELFAQAKKPIDLVITDLVMPNMSGRELTEHILQLAPETLIISSSGFVRSAGEPDQGRYLQKPFTSQALLRKVKQVLTL